MATYHFEHLNDTFDYGQYSGLTLEDVLILNESYIHWCFNNIGKFTISFKVFEEISELFPDFSFFAHYRENIVPNEESDFDSDDDSECYEEDSEINDGSEATYERYAGSWAQDEMGYSDEEIDIVFDGDPDAYWNID